MTRGTRFAMCGGVVVGLVYAVSPIGVLLGAVLSGIACAFVAGLSSSERRWLVPALAAAILLRLAAVALVLMTTDPGRESFQSLFGDGRFVITRSLWLRDYWLGYQLAPDVMLDVFDPYGGDAYFYFFGVIQTLFGGAPYALTLFSIASYVAAVFILHRVVRRAYGATPATLLAVILLFIPSQFVWSVSMLKESLFLLLSVASLAAAIHALRGDQRRVRLVMLATIGACAGGLALLRPGGAVIALGGIGLGLLVWATMRFRAVRIVALTVVLAATVFALRSDRISARIRGVVELAANRHMGHVMTMGRSYRLLDRRIYFDGAQAIATMSEGELGLFLAKSVVAFVAEPLPFDVVSVTERAFAPQQVLWYAMVVLAFLGVVPAMRRDRLTTSILVGYILTAVAVIAPNSGNLGTLVRHRDMVAPVVVCLAAVGACRVLNRAGARRGEASSILVPSAQSV